MSRGLRSRPSSRSRGPVKNERRNRWNGPVISKRSVEIMDNSAELRHRAFGREGIPAFGIWIGTALTATTKLVGKSGLTLTDLAVIFRRACFLRADFGWAAKGPFLEIIRARDCFFQE